MGIIIRQSIKGTFVNYIGSFIGFLTTMIVIPKFLQPEDYGLIQVILNAALFVCAFAQLGTSSSILRFFPHFKNETNNNNGFFFYILLLSTIGLCIFIPLYIFLKEPISAYFSQNASLFVNYYYWIIPLIIFLVFWTAFENYSNVLMRIVIPRFIREVVVRIMILAVYFLFAFNVLDNNGLVGGYILVYGIAMILTFIYISRISSISLKHDFSFIDKPLGKKIRNYTSFLLLSALSGSILGYLDVFMISSHMGFHHTGIYTVAFFMAATIEIPTRSISSIASPIAAKAMKEGDLETSNSLYKKVSLHQLIAGSGIFLLIWINIDNIYAIIPNGDTYAPGKWVVFFLALSKLIFITLNFGAILISFSKYYYWTLFFTIFITGIGIATNLLLIPIYGIVGAAIATLISGILLCAVQQWIVLSKVKGNPYSLNLLKLIIIVLILLGINLLLPHWSNNPIIDGLYRTSIIGSIAVISLYKLRISEEVCMIINNFLKIK
jgi:Membrane protein involved in the export of O-antigen and teichoic acid